MISASELQLEAREQELARRAEQTMFALAAIDEAIRHLRIARCCEQAAKHIDRGILALDEAIEQLEGRAAP